MVISVLVWSFTAVSVFLCIGRRTVAIILFGKSMQFTCSCPNQFLYVTLLFSCLISFNIFLILGVCDLLIRVVNGYTWIFCRKNRWLDLHRLFSIMPCLKPSFFLFILTSQWLSSLLGFIRGLCFSVGLLGAKICSPGEFSI